MYIIMLCVKQGGIKNPFLSLGRTQPRIETRSPESLGNTLFTNSKQVFSEMFSMNIKCAFFRLVSIKNYFNLAKNIF